MQWIRVRILPVGILAVLVVIGLASAVALRPWDGGEAAEVITAEEIRSGVKTGFLHFDSDSPAPSFELTDQNGNRVSLQDFRGKWVVMDWIYTSCLTVCPALTANMKSFRNGLGDGFGIDVQLVSITFDPGRDTVDAMKAHSQRVTSDAPGWLWLTGSQEETDAVAEAYGMNYRPAPGIMNLGDFDHTALVVAIDPEGQERHRYMGTGWSENLLARLGTGLDITGQPDDRTDGSSYTSSVQTTVDDVKEPPPPSSSMADTASVDTFPVQGTLSALRSQAKEFAWDGDTAYRDIDSELVLQFKEEEIAIAWFRAQVDQAVSDGWEILEFEPAGSSGVEYALLEGSDGAILGVVRQLWIAIEIKGTSAKRVYLLLFSGIEDLCCTF
jgi:protein SCO1/2